MKMSSPEKLSTDVVEFGIPVIDGEFAFQRFIDLHGSAGEAEAFWLGRDLEAEPVPSHCTTLSLLTERSWRKQQMRSRSWGAAAKLFRPGAERGPRPLAGAS